MLGLAMLALVACSKDSDDSTGGGDDTGTPSDDSATDDSGTDDDSGTVPNAIRNGDFSKDLKYWANDSDRTPVGVADKLSYGCLPDQKGNPFVYLDVYGNGLAWIEQAFTVPAGATTLHYRLWNALDPATATISFFVGTKETILGTETPPSVQALKDPKDPFSVICSGKKDSSASYDISAFAGQKVKLHMSATAPGNNGTIISFDDIVVE